MEKKSIAYEIGGRPVGLRTWIEVDTGAIRHNFEQIKKLSPDMLIMAVVKSNAYGHGIFDFSKLIEGLGANWLAADSIVEAIALRKSGIELPMLVLGYTLPERLQEAIDNNISITVSNTDALQALMSAKLTGAIRVHIKVDTGLHRQGFLIDEIDGLLSVLATTYSINVEGLYTHFADSKRLEGDAYTDMQIENFITIKESFLKAGFKPLTHAHATAGLVRHGSKLSCDMVRVGAALYGIWPSAELKRDFSSTLILRPALSWKTIISETKSLPVGSDMGYGRSEKLVRDSKVAICPIGYWHGYPGSLSSIGYAYVAGVKAKVLGRVSMDIITIDITDCRSAALHDVVTLIGDAEMLATAAGISVHELLTRINPKIERIYI